MPEIYRKLEVHFSKAEIQSILAKHARATVLSRKENKHVEMEIVKHVEGEAIVVLTIGPPEVM
jgi:hypothetical protein